MCAVGKPRGETVKQGGNGQLACVLRAVEKTRRMVSRWPDAGHHEMSRPGGGGMGLDCRGQGRREGGKNTLGNSPEQLCCVESRGIVGKGKVGYKECFCFILKR